jgi:hypothetical protein
VRQHEFCRSVGIFFDLVVPQPEDNPALRFEEAGSAVVIITRFGVLTAVQLDCELRLAAREVDDEGFDHELAGEAGAIVAQAQPEEAFSLGRVAAQLAGVFGELLRDTFHCASVAGLASLATHPQAPPWKGGQLGRHAK